MSRPVTDSRPRPADAPDPVFAAPMCGIDGSLKARAAALQAAAIAGPGARITLVSVAYEIGSGLSQAAALSPARARDALADVEHALWARGAEPATEVAETRGAAHALLERCGDHDLLAVGAPAGSRAEGASVGDVGSVIVHRAPIPVLVARPSRDRRSFPRHVVVASDGSEGALRAVQLAAGIAGLRRARVTVLHVGRHGKPRHRRLLANETTELMLATGTEPVVTIEDGNPVARIVEVARRESASLIVVGSRGLVGVKALGSVSERVAHCAPCSVLVARPGVQPAT